MHSHSLPVQAMVPLASSWGWAAQPSAVGWRDHARAQRPGALSVPHSLRGQRHFRKKTGSRTNPRSHQEQRAMEDDPSLTIV